MLFGALLLVHFLQVLSVSGLPTEAIWRDPYTVTKNPNGLKAHLPTGLRHRKVHGSSPKNDLIATNINTSKTSNQMKGLNGSTQLKTKQAAAGSRWDQILEAYINSMGHHTMTI
ncbi:hypothetical protein KEM48_004002 [Puccinia striiformis f. sp. tritici PST-130]|nr:hypothetical protein KEM48_004002 [Puccinia striiformis f. sp. tritici PST-130]